VLGDVCGLSLALDLLELESVAEEVIFIRHPLELAAATFIVIRAPSVSIAIHVDGRTQEVYVAPSRVHSNHARVGLALGLDICERTLGEVCTSLADRNLGEQVPVQVEVVRSVDGVGVGY